MTTSSVYRIRNGKGLWSNGGARPSFSTRGKAWVSIGALKMHIRSQLERSHYDKGDANEPWKKLTNNLPEDWEIVEFIVRETDTDLIQPISTIVEKMKRRERLDHFHGLAFANLVDRMDERNQASEYRWCLCYKHDYKIGDFSDTLIQLLKDKKLKRNTDIQIAQCNNDIAVSFKEKSEATMFKLAFPQKLTGVDILDFVETNLDTES